MAIDAVWKTDDEKTSLEDHLIWQLRLSKMTEKEEGLVFT